MTTAPVSLSLPAPAPFRPLAGTARWARRALVLAIVVDVVAVFSGLAELRLLDRAATGGATESELLASDRRQQLVAVAQLAALVVGAIFFLRWFQRAYANLRPLGAEPKHSSGWAVGYWFIPILNFFRPVQMAGEIARGCDTHAGRGPSALVGCWWLTLIGSGLIERFAASTQSGASTLADLEAASWLCLVANAAAVTAGLLALAVVSRLTARQEAAAGRQTTGFAGQYF